MSQHVSWLLSEPSWSLQLPQEITKWKGEKNQNLEQDRWQHFSLEHKMSIMHWFEEGQMEGVRRITLNTNIYGGKKMVVV